MHRGPTLERELLDLLGGGRIACIAARHLGFDGLGGARARIVGNEYGMSRERVRQIVMVASNWLAHGRRVSPMLDRTIAHVVDRMPATAGEIEAELRSERLAGNSFRLEGVVKAAELLGRAVPFLITEVKKGNRLVHQREIPSVDAIVLTSRRLVSRQGVATVSDVIAKVREVEPAACDRKLVISALACLPDFHWLDLSADWFWLADNPYNRALNRMRKILSIANPIDISGLQAGIGRDYPIKGFSPPKGILLELCRQTPGLFVEDEMVGAEPMIDPEGVLTEVEGQIVRILSEHGGATTTKEFKSVCLSMGVNCRTFYQCLVRSPIISKYPGGMFGIVGGTAMRSGRRGVQ